MSRQIGDIPTRTFNPGDVIFREGDDPKGEAFMVHVGKVEIKKLDRRRAAPAHAPSARASLLGELALFRNAPALGHRHRRRGGDPHGHPRQPARSHGPEQSRPRRRADQGSRQPHAPGRGGGPRRRKARARREAAPPKPSSAPSTRKPARPRPSSARGPPAARVARTSGTTPQAEGVGGEGGDVAADGEGRGGRRRRRVDHVDGARGHADLEVVHERAVRAHRLGAHARAAALDVPASISGISFCSERTKAALLAER